eukprot:m.9867 g.9867  ORF g.9867 m.9867 type:complete len:274 (-) comp6439_c0_seq1:121-942(-)
MMNPICEVSVMHDKKETVPPGWDVIHRSVSGKEANLNAGSNFFMAGSKMFLCYRRAQPNNDPVVITGLMVHVEGKGSIPPGYTVQTQSVTKTRDGNLNHKGGGKPVYLSVQTGNRASSQMALSDIVVLRKGDALPGGYTQLQGDVNARAESVFLAVKYTQLTSQPQFNFNSVPAMTQPHNVSTTSSLPPQQFQRHSRSAVISRNTVRRTASKAAGPHNWLVNVKVELSPSYQKLLSSASHHNSRSPLVLTAADVDRKYNFSFDETRQIANKYQ